MTMTLEAKTLGILGGGQLGRMSAQAAAELGINVHIYCPEQDCPASQVAAKTFIGAYEDEQALKEFAASVDVISYEFENIPIETVRFLRTLKPVYPDDKLLEIAQDRSTEKQFLNDNGIPTVAWKSASSAKEVQDAINEMPGSDFIIKTARFGYDGKGQVSCNKSDDSVAKYESLNTKDVIIEQKTDFACEISVIIGRDKDGHCALYGPALNEHENHILAKSTIPAPISDELSEKARRLAENLAKAVDLIGVLALEMFVTRDNELLANEIAPRTHNSGHWSIDACKVSQFAQHIRTVCGMGVKPPELHSKATMINLIGDDVHDLGQWEEMKNAKIHLYGKAQAREGRKMGHVTIIEKESA